MAQTTIKSPEELKLPNPGVTWKWLIDLLVVVLSPVIAVLTAGLRKELQELLTAWYRKAKETANPWDDWAAELLLRILGFELPS